MEGGNKESQNGNVNQNDPSNDLYTFFNPYDGVNVYRQNLPHWQQKNVWYFVTFRLWDSLPKEVIEQIKYEREVWLRMHKDFSLLSEWERKEYYYLFNMRIERYLDTGMGSCILRNREVAKIVSDAMCFFEGQRYVLDDWVIMPNHVHVLVKPIGEFKLFEILHSWKSYSSKKINKLLGKRGGVWMRESFDHIVRNREAFLRFRKYIFNNPIKAGLSLDSVLGKFSWREEEGEQDAPRY